MPRRKQYFPKRHDGGTNSVTPEQTVPTDQQVPTPPLDCTKNLKPPESDDQKPDHRVIEPIKSESALDLSVRKRHRSSGQNSNGYPAKIPKSEASSRKDTNWPSSIAQTSVPNLVNDDAVNSSAFSAPTRQSTDQFVRLFPPFRFSFPAPFSPLSSPSTSTQGQNGAANGDSLSKLSSFVHQLGKGQKQASSISLVPGVTPTTANVQAPVNGEGGQSLQEALGVAAGHGLSFQELWLRFVKKEENAELKRLNEAKQIFTCLQCHASFQTMEQLVKHMETTQHYANIPKHYSWSLQYARQRMRQMKMKMKYSDKMMYYCFLCTGPFTEPVHIHFNCVHNMHNPVENMKFVHVISVNGKNVARGATSVTSSSSIGRRAGSSTTPPSTNGEMRIRYQSNDEEIHLSSSPLSVGGSSCESGSVSPSPSSSSKRSITACQGCSFSPPIVDNPIDCRISISDPGAYTDNLLLKMEKLVQTAVGENNQKTRVESDSLKRESVI